MLDKPKKAMKDSTHNHCSEATSTVFIAVLSAISFIALVGNFLVVITFFKTANLRTSSNYYIVNMAASDVLCSYFSWLVYATEGAITGRMWISDPLASVLCKIGIYVRVTSQIVSVLSLVAIAVDRYFAIVFPLRTTSMHKERVRFAILLFIWITSGALCCPGILYAKVVQSNGDNFCRLLWNQSAYKIYHSIGIVLLYFTPLITIIIFYYRILRTLRARPMSGNGLRDSQNITLTQNQQVIKILISIVFAFFLCWTPLCIYFVLKIFKPDLFLQDTCHISVVLLFYVFSSLITVINPVILFLFSTNYRQALANLRARCRVNSVGISPLHVTTVQMMEIH